MPLPLLLGALFAFPAPCLRAEATRDISVTAIALRQSVTLEARQATLSHAYDASGGRWARAVPTDGTLRRYRRVNWFPKGYKPESGRRAFSMPELYVPPRQPTLIERLLDAVRSAATPYRMLLDYAWGGSWGGATVVRKFLTDRRY